MLQTLSLELGLRTKKTYWAMMWSSCIHIPPSDESAGSVTTQPIRAIKLQPAIDKGRGKVPPGFIIFGGAGHLIDQIFHAPGAKLWHYAAELCTFSVTYPLCGSTLTNTTDNQPEMCPLKLTDFCLFLYHWSYTIFQGPLIPPHDFHKLSWQGSNLLPPNGRAITLTTQQIRLA